MPASFLHVFVCLLAAIALIVLMTAKYRVHAFFALLAACLVVGPGTGMPMSDLLNAMRDGFGNIMRSLGLIIVLGTSLGAVLEHTGSTRVMADSILRWTGEKRAALAMTLTGFIVGMPIFCDSGFIVLSGLNQTLARKTKTPMAYMSVSLAAGLYSVHCLIPPHPGAAAAAGILAVDYGRLILAGISVAIPATVVGHLWARFATRKESSVAADAVTPPENNLPDSLAAISAPDSHPSAAVVSSSAHDSHPSAPVVSAAPSTIMAFLPVLVPILLIASRSFITLETNHPSIAQHIITALGDPIIALTVGLILALAGMNRQSRGGFSHLMNEAVEKAGSILVIIGAGGAFGAVLTATHIGETLSHTLPLTGLGLFFPFILTALLKTAQGSSTVAIITAASIIHPLQPTLGLSDPHGSLICMLSMGAGSMMISHANDAFFWVIARFGGMDLKTMLRVYSMASLLMGLTALLATYVIFLL